MNPIAKLQKWMDSPNGQVFMNYAYSWGAAIVILGTLFKLTHIPGANAMLFIGMGTEVFVFFISGFEKTYEKVPKAEHQNMRAGETIVVTGGIPSNPEETVTPQGPVVIQGGNAPLTSGGTQQGAQVVSPSPTIIVGGTSATPAAGSATPAATSTPSASATASPSLSAASSAGDALKGAEGLSAAAANLAAAGQAAAQAQLALGQLQHSAAGIDPSLIKSTDPTAVEEAVEKYAQELKELTEVLGRVKEQAARMSTDSEEMENLNRTLTGIATVYELQLRNISKQVSTIEQIDEQTRRMAQQIEELNNVYGRMIKALTVNMGNAAAAKPTATPTAEE